MKGGPSGMSKHPLTKTIVVILSLLFLSTALIPTIQAQFAEGLGNPQPPQGPLTALFTPAPPHQQTPRPLTTYPLVIKLPSSQVTIYLRLGTTLSYLNTTLSNVPGGYDVINHWYNGWCGDYFHYINLQQNYQATLYSTYDNALPTYLYHANWSKINYVLNHRVGTSYQQVQDAIWYLLDCGNLGLNTQGWALVNAARGNGSFIPAPGQICAVLLGVSTTVQRTLIEVTVPARTLTLTCNGSGSITKTPNLASYVYGQLVNLTATASPGWTFDHWTGDATGNTTTTSLTMNGDKTATASFTQNHYTLTLTTNGNGSINKNPSQANYTYNQTVQLAAQPQPGWTFDHWTGDATGTTTSVNVTIIGNKAATAYFTQNQYTLSLATIGNGSIDNEPTLATYVYGQVIHLTAQPQPGWSFSYWTGDATGTTNPINITVTDNTTATAHFTQLHYTLALTAIGNGSLIKNPDYPSYLYSQVVHITAQPSLGWSFDHWTGDATGPSPTANITITHNSSATAHFTQDQYTLSVSTNGSGTIQISPQQTTYVYGQKVYLTAMADLGWTFNHWAGAANGTANPVNFTMAGHAAVTGYFTQNQYTLTLSVNGNGSILKNPSQSTYTYGQIVHLTAQPQAGWTFNHWSGNASGNALTVDVTITANAAVTAHFTQDQYTLSVTLAGSGTVTKNPSQATYVYGQVVRLTAQPTLGWSFGMWTGNATGTTNPVNVTMTGNKAVTAHFTQNQYTVTVSSVGSGTVTRTPNQSTYIYGQTVNLTAIPNPGWTFSFWSGNATGTANPVQITVTGNMAAAAHFTQNQYTLTTSVNGNGTITRLPNQSTYTYGQSVQLTAVAAAGWTFNHWSGNVTGTTNPVNITINGNKAVTAHFTQNQYTIAVSVNGSGTVTKDPEQTTYVYGQVVRLTAIPSPGWSFNYWGGDATGSVNPVEVTVNGNLAVTAYFTQIQYILSVSTVGSGTVVKNPEQATYTYGQTVQLTAQPAANWTFDHWSGNATGTTNPVTITISGNASVTAHFSMMDLWAPTVHIDQPIDAVYLLDRMLCPFTMPLFFHNLTVIVNATDNMSGVDHVEIFIDNVSKAVLTTPPYQYLWSEPKPMKHVLKAVATDKAGNSAVDSMLVWRWRMHPVIIGYFIVKAIMWHLYNGAHPVQTESS